MSTIQGYKGRVLLVPFEREGAKAVTKNAFSTVEHKSTLVGLEVVYGNGVDIHPGDIVFVKPDGQKSWGEYAVDVDGKRVVVCPPEFVVAVKRSLRAATAPELPAPDKSLFPTIVK